MEETLGKSTILWEFTLCSDFSGSKLLSGGTNATKTDKFYSNPMVSDSVPLRGKNPTTTLSNNLC